MQAYDSMMGRKGVAEFLLSTLCAALLAGCPAARTEAVSSDDFVSISELGFDAVDYAQDLNDYAWSMAYFVPDGAATGRLYVSTANSPVNLVMERIGVNLSVSPVYRPPEIRRYRPDLGSKTWERVLDYRDIETGPDWQTTGIRDLATYRPAGGPTTFTPAPSAMSRPSGARRPAKQEAGNASGPTRSMARCASLPCTTACSTSR